MDNRDRELTIELCMGSSCFARGNRDALPLITELLDARGCRERVEIKGHLCADRCARGPLIVINGETYTGMSPEAAVDLVGHRYEE